MKYPYNLLEKAAAKGTEAGEIAEALRSRPFLSFKESLEASAGQYVASAELKAAANSAIAFGRPLLLTGASGTGKTQAAFWIAWQLGLEAPLEFHVKSTSLGRDLLYTFDSVAYFRDAWAAAAPGARPPGEADQDLKRPYVQPGKLWQALADNEGNPNQQVKVLLIDEIDKAPRDFPNDLLFELDQLRFTVPETGIQVPKAGSAVAQRPIVVITSNSERRLPEPFLRRCFYHHIEFDLTEVEKAARRRIKADQFPPLAMVDDELPAEQTEFLKRTLKVFNDVRNKTRQKVPATGEYLHWLQAFLHCNGAKIEKLEGPLAELDLLHLLVKDKDDRKLFAS